MGGAPPPRALITELLAVKFNGYRALTALARGQIPGPRPAWQR